MPAQDPLNSLAGDTAIFTTWGACKLYDLARLSASRDSAAQTWADCIAEHQARAAAVLADFADNVAPELDPAAAEAQQSELAAALDAALTDLKAARDQDLALRLPEIVVDENTTVPCLAVTQVGESTSIVRVVISQVAVGEPPQNVDVAVRCGAAASFDTANGPVLAADIDGATLQLHAGGTFVASSEVVVYEDPVPLYRVACAAEVCCVGADSSVAARVHVVA